VASRGVVRHRYTTNDGNGVVVRDPVLGWGLTYAGIGLSGSFIDRPVEDSVRLMQLTVMSVLRLTHAALQPLIERGRGDIVNVSSVAAYTPGGRDSIYGASKAWVTTFSESASPGGSTSASSASPGTRRGASCAEPQPGQSAGPLNWGWSSEHRAERDDISRDDNSPVAQGLAPWATGGASSRP
jgi:NAD(P)-dependent dehydrogenase (short-subunit alcohol dehydrogenase family)